jgi:hypothetical protein
MFSILTEREQFLMLQNKKRDTHAAMPTFPTTKLTQSYIA